jgi:hypothetical protein
MVFCTPAADLYPSAACCLDWTAMGRKAPDYLTEAELIGGDIRGAACTGGLLAATLVLCAMYPIGLWNIIQFRCCYVRHGASAVT